MNALKKITDRARQLKKKHPGAKWTSLTKQASAEYRAGKLGAATKTKKSKARKPKKKKKVNRSRQTGSSNKHYDQQRAARNPGPRIPRGGRKVTYTERRKNRSDAPGSLTGLKSMITTAVAKKLASALITYDRAKTIKATKKASALIKKYRAELRKFS